METRAHRPVWVILSLVAVTTIAVVVARGLGGPGGVAGRTYDEAAAATEVGDWATAFKGFRPPRGSGKCLAHTPPSGGARTGHQPVHLPQCVALL